MYKITVKMQRNMHAGAIHYLFSSYVCIYEEQLDPEKIINLFTS